MSLSKRAMRTSLSLGLVTLALAGLTACGGEEEESAPTKARMVFMHQARVLGNIDLLANGEKVAELARGETSSPVSLAAEATTFEVRNSGADVNVLDTSLELLAQPYLVAVVGETLDDLRFWTVAEPAPELEEGEAAVRVVNLDTTQTDGYDFYVDEQLVAEGLGPVRASDFVKVSLADTDALETSVAPREVAVRVLTPGVDPGSRAFPISPSTVELRNRRAYILVVQPDPEDPSLFKLVTVAP